jgi:hypothetical protein
MTMPPENNSAGPAPDEHIPIPDEHYAAIGKMADSWADLEFEIDQLIWKLLCTAQALGACVTSQLISVHPKLDALATKRNRLIHDKRMIWFTSREVVRFEISAKGGLKFEPVPETPEYLINFSREVYDQISKFHSIRDKIAADIAASPDKAGLRFPHITQTQAQKPILPIES